MKIEIRSLTMIYPGKKQKTVALDSVSLNIPSGKIVSVIGNSGSGKTTLLKAISGFLVPSAGEVLINGVSIYEMDNPERKFFLKDKIYLVFQDIENNLFFNLSGYENAELILFQHNLKKDIIQHFHSLGLVDLLYQKVSTLSGGQKQLLIFGIILLLDCKIIVMDEPTSHMDQASKHLVMEKISDYCRKKGITLIYSTHDPDIIKYSDVGIGIYFGRFDRIIEKPSSNRKTKEIMDGVYHIVPVSPDGTIRIPNFMRQLLGIHEKVKLLLKDGTIVVEAYGGQNDD